MSESYYPVQSTVPPVLIVRELLASSSTTEDTWVDLLRSAYATGYTDAQAGMEPSIEWDAYAASLEGDR